MKKKVGTVLLVLTMTGSLISCGKEKVESESKEPIASVAEESKEKEPTVEVSEEGKKDENKEWGVYYKAGGESGEGKTITYSVHFPSLVPADKIANIAFQMDPTLALVGFGGRHYRADSLENVLSACTDLLVMDFDMYRPYNYTDFAFNIDSQELVTINDFPMCKYTGTHTFKVDEQSYEIPFVAYSVDFQTGPESYIYLMVLDESVLHTDRPAVEDGVIEEYAYRMAQSLHLR